MSLQVINDFVAIQTVELFRGIVQMSDERIRKNHLARDNAGVNLLFGAVCTPGSVHRAWGKIIHQAYQVVLTRTEENIDREGISTERKPV